MTGPANDDRQDRGRGSIADSLRRWEERLRVSGGEGIASGGGRQMGPLFFDPAGADFTAWVNHFKNEVYRNWILPQSVLLGARGRVDIEFTVGRDGRVAGLRVTRSSGLDALDRAAQNALVSSVFLPLPSNYAPMTVTMFVTFFYNQGPASS